MGPEGVDWGIKAKYEAENNELPVGDPRIVWCIGGNNDSPAMCRQMLRMNYRFSDWQPSRTRDHDGCGWNGDRAVGGGTNEDAANCGVGDFGEYREPAGVFEEWIYRDAAGCGAFCSQGRPTRACRARAWRRRRDAWDSTLVLAKLPTMPPRGNEALDFTPILTHYLFLFTSILSIVRSQPFSNSLHR